ncbi:DUF1840 domain-containing protein [Polynucleobacter sp. 30F-ANTBAC]|nr:DUF1840 domain-containing protein [Polynucleobacter sp. 30F-ANTBAC]
MLYKFQCKNSADVFMLSDLTQLIFNTIDKPLESKGIFLVEQLQPAIEKLEAAIARDNELRQAVKSDKLSDDLEDKTPKADRFGQRVFPFIQLLKAALTNEEMITWGV